MSVHYPRGCSARASFLVTLGCLGRRGRAVVWLVGAVWFLPTASRAQDQADDTLRAVRLTGDSRIVVDGLLNEPIWKQAPAISDFRQKEPNEGEPATEKTEVRLVYDGDVMYVGILAYDRSPRDLIARLLARDKVMETEFDGKPKFAGDDGVAILIDPFHDHRNAFVFATNPNGAEFDGLIGDEGRSFNIDWRGIWSVAARRVSEGWSAEFAIPFRTLRYPATPGTWGFNVYRMIRRKNEEVLWRGYSRSNEGFARVSRAGHIVGLNGLPAPGLNADIKPYVMTGGDETYSSLGARSRSGIGDVGVDLKSEVHPGLVLDLTYNTDFAQVEADDEQVNLTRFDLFFPEKREFFLENSGMFEFGARGGFEPPPFQLFFSRTIGIADSGAVPVLGGGRLTGRLGGQTVGLLSIYTGEKYGLQRTGFNVARVKRDLGSSNYVGAMLVDRRSDSTWNTAGGIDWSFWPKSALNVQGFVAGTATQGPGGNDIAYRMATDYQTDRIGINAQHLVIGPNTEADAGFITRTDIRRTEANLRYTLRPQALNLRRINLNFRHDLYTDMAWKRQDYRISYGFRPIFNSDDGVGIFFAFGRNRIDEAFDLADTVHVDPGDYPYRSFSIFANTSPSRAISADLNSDLEQSFGGSVNRVNTSLTANLGIHLQLKTSYTYSWARLPNGAFDAHLVGLRVGYAFTTRLSFNSLMQYNTLARDVSVNARLNYIFRPGSDIFLVFNEGRGSIESPWDLRERGVRLKLTYLARL